MSGASTVIEDAAPAAGESRGGAQEALPAIRLPVFEGPLDLLLQLIQRRDLDITAVSLAAVADQYLAAVHADEGLGAPALAEFVFIGAKLLELKSRALLPEREPTGGEGQPQDDPGDELVTMLREYQRFREAAERLGERAAAGLRSWPRGATPPAGPPGDALGGVTLDALHAVMLEVLARLPEEPPGVVERTEVSLAARVAALEALLAGKARSFSFRRAISECRTRLEAVVTFIALLELLKRGACEVEQAEAWGDIRVRAAGGR